LSITARPGLQAVYNLEIDLEHVYYVSTSALLVHNAYQDHHAIPWNNKKYHHESHPLVRKAKVNLKTYKKNIKSLENHAGRHSRSYHDAVAERLNAAYEGVAGKGKAEARAALDRVIQGIWRDIRNGKLRPYDNKHVILP